MIVGAGLAGLIAAHVFPREEVYEVAEHPAPGHRALLRFRSPVVSELTGIPFRPVTVRKGVWSEGRWRQADIRLANLYSRKVLAGRLLDRSVWELEPVTRWVAPDDLYERMVDAVAARIHWATPIHLADRRSEPAVSTIPMNWACLHVGIDLPTVDFARAEITVRRFGVPGADVFQTGYFPDPQHTLYRASITGSTLICEFAGEPEGEWLSEVMSAFALGNVESREEARQHYGKIAPIPEPVRREVIARLTREHNVFSLGRFATWRNILLDDVVHDAAVVKRLINATDYERRLAALGGE